MSETEVARERRVQTVIGSIRQVWTHSHFDCEACGFESKDFQEVVDHDCAETNNP